MEPYDAYATGILRAAKCDVLGPVSADALLRGLGIRASISDDAYSGHAQGGLTVEHGVDVVWTPSGIPAATRIRLQLRLVAQWWLLRRGFRPATAARMARSLGARLSAIGVGPVSELIPRLERAAPANDTIKASPRSAMAPDSVRR